MDKLQTANLCNLVMAMLQGDDQHLETVFAVVDAAAGLVESIESPRNHAGATPRSVEDYKQAVCRIVAYLQVIEISLEQLKEASQETAKKTV